ncbi:flagellar export protein FliJ [Thiohalobacter sp. IOR34]|uniref:flagellar export protein FliJ n=1 Tax=Thiohalobacter sp. IOR34 TaxID=3057176 RepID=UPI0025AF8585|nr:flagellar export protein FliJ [Thiohalobacter sp. IOR34]WJW74571.1 flagellar export protein FliJ [Thiohalobacter sp. IOR34]
MSRSRRMRPVVEVADRREQQAARILGEARRRLQEEEAKLAQLIEYHADYARRLEAGSGASLSAARLQDFRLFLDRLAQAIRQQRERIERQRLDCEEKRLAWLATRSRSQALDKVVERYQREEQKAAARREQRESDEQAQHGSRRRKPR